MRSPARVVASRKNECRDALAIVTMRVPAVAVTMPPNVTRVAKLR